MSERIDLPRKLDSAAAVELFDRLRVEPRTPVIVDAAATEHLGALGAEVLMVAARSRTAAGIGFSIEHLGEGVMDQLATLGLRSVAPFGGAAKP